MNLLLEEKLNDVWVQKYTGTDLEAAIAIPSFTPGGGYDLNYAWRLTKTGTENDYVFDIYWEQGSSHPIELKLTDAGNPNGTETTYEDWTAAKVYIRHRDAQL